SYQSLYAAMWQPGSAFYLSKLESHYGRTAVEEARQADERGTPMWADADLSARYPLFEEALTTAEAAIEHSSDHRRVLEAFSAEHSLDEIVHFVGRQPDDVLESYMAQADLFINLRSPTLEGGSASLMRQLPYGRPVIAYDSGVFGEVPRDALAHVAPRDDA